MKANYLFFLIFSFILFKCNIKKEATLINQSFVGVSKDFNNMYEIVKIDSIENVFLIYAKSNDSIFKIVSQKEISPNCNHIQLNESYDLKIVSVFPENFTQKRDKYGIKIYSTLIKFENDSIVWDLFITKNLKGLCYIESPKQ